MGRLQGETTEEDRDPEDIRRRMEKDREGIQRREAQIDELYPEKEDDEVLSYFRGILKGHAGYPERETATVLERAIDDIKRWHKNGGQDDLTQRYHEMPKGKVSRLIQMLETEIERLKVAGQPKNEGQDDEKIRRKEAFDRFMEENRKRVRQLEAQIDELYPEREGDVIFNSFRAILKANSGYPNKVEMTNALERIIREIRMWHKNGGQDELAQRYHDMPEGDVDLLIRLLEKEVERLEAEK